MSVITGVGRPAETTDAAAPPLLAVRDLDISYEAKGFWPWAKRRVPIVQDVSFDIAPRETLGLVGESGSGKSTTGRAILRLLDVDAGTIRFGDEEVTAFGRKTPLSYRRDVQAVFQDPNSSLNPRHPVITALTNAMRRHGIGENAKDRDRRASEVFEQVGLQRAHLQRYPFELSGGQQQRVAIARAIVLEPKLIVCDEAVSALDLSTQGQIINLLADLQDQTGVSYLFVAHDLAVVRHISDRIAVMQKGKIVELAGAHDIFEHPQHPYTRRLIGASPADHPEGRDERRERRREFRIMRETGLKPDVEES